MIEPLFNNISLTVDELNKIFKKNKISGVVVPADQENSKNKGKKIYSK